MKFLSALFGVVVLLLIAAFLYEHHKTTELHASLVALGKDRDGGRARKRGHVRNPEFFEALASR